MINILVGALLALIGGGALRWWQYRRDAWIKHADRFCDCVDLQAKTGITYWVKDAAAAPFELAALEAEIGGTAARIDGFWAQVNGRLSNASKARIDDLLNEFDERATGGQFQVKGRAADYERAQLVAASASEVNVAMREAIDDALSLPGALRFVWDRSRRWQPEED